MSSVDEKNHIYSQSVKDRGKAKRVYFFKHMDTQAIKIGRSSDPEFRLKGLNSKFHGRLECLGICSEPSSMAETTLHNFLADWALGGEWFKGCPEMESVVFSCLDEGLTAGIMTAKELHDLNINA